jgi:hypothetical protein
MSLDYGNPVEEFKKVYDVGDDDLLDSEQLKAPGVFEGEREFIHFAEGDYETDKHWAFEIKPEECALIVVDMQQDFVNPGNPMCVPQAYRQVPRIKALIDGCRKANMPVFYTEHHIGSDRGRGDQRGRTRHQGLPRPRPSARRADHQRQAHVRLVRRHGPRLRAAQSRCEDGDHLRHAHQLLL